jgi:hypothetical protein
MGPVRALLTLTGLVALAAGLYGALTGIDGMSGASAGTVNVDSEYRFLSVFWAAYGAYALHVARRPRIDPRLARALVLVLFCGGLARGLSWALEGRPDTLYLVLLALELAVPLAVLALLTGERRSLR